MLSWIIKKKKDTEKRGPECKEGGLEIHWLHGSKVGKREGGEMRSKGSRGRKG